MKEMNNNVAMEVIAEMAQKAIEAEAEKRYVVYQGMVMSYEEFKEMIENERGF